MDIENYKSKLNGQYGEIEHLREVAKPECLSTKYNPCLICHGGNYILRHRLGITVEKEELLICAVKEIFCPEGRNPGITKRDWILIKV